MPAFLSSRLDTDHLLSKPLKKRKFKLNWWIKLPPVQETICKMNWKYSHFSLWADLKLQDLFVWLYLILSKIEYVSTSLLFMLSVWNLLLCCCLSLTRTQILNLNEIKVKLNKNNKVFIASDITLSESFNDITLKVLRMETKVTCEQM